MLMGLRCRGEHSRGSWGFWSTSSSCSLPPLPLANSTRSHPGWRAACWRTTAHRCSRVRAEEPLVQWPTGPGVPASITGDRTQAGLSHSNTSLGQAGATKVWGLELLLLATQVCVPPSSDAPASGWRPLVWAAGRPFAHLLVRWGRGGLALGGGR